MYNNYLHKIKLFFAVILLFNLQYSPAMAKSLARSVADERWQASIRGTVTNVKGEPLPGAVVSVKNGKAVTSTGVNGDFTLAANIGDVLVVKLIGYETKEVPVASNASLNIALEESNTGLNEVVVIGYGTQKKKDLTGAISSVKTSDLVLGQGPEIGNMLKGKVPGLTIRQNSAQPGGGLDILVRGAGSVNASNAPLFVVDGFPISELTQPETGGRYNAGSQSFLTSFNPNDIESVEVLKDASATAIYGSRAANGVILITTKHGADGKAKVDYQANYTFQKFKNPFDILPLNEWMQVRNEQGQEQWNYDNHIAPYGTAIASEVIAGGVQAYRKLYTQNAINNVGGGTDWMKLVTRNGTTMQHNISVSGGAKGTKYFISANYYDQDGVVKNSGLERYSLRANIDQELSKIFKFGVNLTASRIDNLNSQLGGDQYENSGVIRAAIQQGPHIQAIDEDGNYPINPQLVLQPNPYSLLTIKDQGRVERMLLNSFLDITPIKDLVIRLKGGVDRGYTLRQSYIPKATIQGALENGRAFVGNSNSDNYLLELTANYRKTIGNGHNFELLAGASKQKFIDQNSTAGATGFITDAFLWNNLGAGTNIQTPTSSGPKNEIASYFGRLNYNFNSRYLFTATVRTDGASVFAKNHKWGTFPSAAVAWNIAEEPFFAKMKNVVSQLKVRFSYGQTGNAQINGGNRFSNAFAAYSAYSAWLSAADTKLTGVSLSRLENPDLKWETTTGANLGLDYSLFDDKVSGSIEVFHNVISDLLAVKDLNSYQEINSVIYNVGKTVSKGIEVSINVRNIKTENFQWRTLYTFSKYKDNWKERAPDWKPNVYESAQDPIRSNFNYVSDGILQIGEAPPAAQPLLLPGMIKIKDSNGYVRDANGHPEVDANGRFLRSGKPDGIIDDADERLFGTTDPSAMAGITNILKYKRLSLNFDFNGLFGRSMQDPNYVTYGVSAYGVYSNGYNALRSVKNRWTPTNPSTTQPSSFYGFSQYPVGDFFMEKSWFIRLQNVSIGYDIPVKWSKGVVSSMRFHLDGQNIFVITPYKGVDPETDSYTAAYPNIRSFLAGLNVTF